MKTVPIHVALIPDGNRRWARKNNLPDFEGHRIASEKTLPKIIEECQKAGVKYFTFWALSTENAKKRSLEENKNLVNLMRMFLKSKIKDFKKKNIRIQVIGDITAFPEDVQLLIRNAMRETESNTALTVIFAVNYGGRDELVRAINKVIAQGNIDTVTSDHIRQNLDTSNVPDPDLVIRTGGEKRLSGFMLWQSEYAEYSFIDTLFPEFNEQDWAQCLSNFANRERRFGS